MTESVTGDFSSAFSNNPHLSSFAFVIPLEKFVYRRDGAWNFAEPVGKEGIRHHLLAARMDEDLVDETLRKRQYLMVYGQDLAPNQKPIFKSAEGKFYINTWVPPELQPVAGKYPRIQSVLNHLTKKDPEGIRWLKHWMAWKVQNPTLVPKVAVVLATQQGGGKGTLAFCMRAMLGFANTAIVKREELGNKFNSRWIGKLFVLGDEVLSNDSIKDVSNLLKILIDGNEIEVEGKNKDQRAITNKLAWMFASNDKIAPLVLERGDRRYSVFTNHDPLSDEYRELLNTSFEADRKTPTPAFAAEMAALYHELLHTEVDRTFVSMPYSNGAREDLIEANLPMHELFMQYVNDVGIDGVIKEVAERDYSFGPNKATWDFGDKGVAVSAVYRCYVDYCKHTGGKSLKLNRFCAAVKNADVPWNYDRVPFGKLKVGVYVLPRGEVVTP
jgi:hypothetical protein